MQRMSHQGAASRAPRQPTPSLPHLVTPQPPSRHLSPGGSFASAAAAHNSSPDATPRSTLSSRWPPQVDGNSSTCTAVNVPQ
eukprot:351758-Chlamydomonas_euryale.AAC.1